MTKLLSPFRDCCCRGLGGRPGTEIRAKEKGYCASPTLFPAFGHLVDLKLLSKDRFRISSGIKTGALKNLLPSPE